MTISLPPGKIVPEIPFRGINNDARVKVRRIEKFLVGEKLWPIEDVVGCEERDHVRQQLGSSPAVFCRVFAEDEAKLVRLTISQKN